MPQLNPLAGYKITANTPGHVEVSKDGIHVKTFRNFADAGEYCDIKNKQEARMYTYATTMRNGYFGDTTKILTCHKTADAAIKQAKKSEYTDETGTAKQPVAAVTSEYGFEKGQTVYRGNSYPDVIW